MESVKYLTYCEHFPNIISIKSTPMICLAPHATLIESGINVGYQMAFAERQLTRVKFFFLCDIKTKAKIISL